MKKLLSIFILLSLFSIAFAVNPGNGFYTLLSNTTTGITDTIELINFYTEHLFVPYFVGSGVSDTEFTINTAKTCTNSSEILGSCSYTDDTTTVSYLNRTSVKTCNSTYSNISGTCAGTNARGGSNYTVNESANFSIPLEFTLNLTNNTLGLYNASFRLLYRAGYFGNNTGVTNLYIYNGTTWELIGPLATNGFTDDYYANIRPFYYAQGNKMQIKINNTVNSSTASNGSVGIVVDYIALNVVHTPLAVVNETAGDGAPLNLTINISNTTLGNSSSAFNIVINGAYLGSNVTGNTSIYLWKNNATWEDQELNLSVNEYSTITISDLNPANYSLCNETLVRFNHSSNATTGNTGIAIDRMSIVLAANTTVTANANITMQASIDNVNWFDYLSVTDASTTPSLNGVNRTARFIRFNVTTMLMANQTGNALKISYAARGN